MAADGLQTLEGELSIDELQPVIKMVRETARLSRRTDRHASGALPDTVLRRRHRRRSPFPPCAQALQATLADAAYDSSKVAAWSAAVTDGVLKGLAALQKPYKFVVAAVFMQRAGGGLHNAAAALWDAKKDGMYVAARRAHAAAPLAQTRARARALRPRPCRAAFRRSCNVAWENSTMHCIVTVVGLAVSPSPQDTEA